MVVVKASSVSSSSIELFLFLILCSFFICACCVSFECVHDCNSVCEWVFFCVILLSATVCLLLVVRRLFVRSLEYLIGISRLFMKLFVFLFLSRSSVLNVFFSLLLLTLLHMHHHHHPPLYVSPFPFLIVYKFIIYM